MSKKCGVVGFPAAEPDLVEAISKASQNVRAIWRQARQDAD